MPNIERYCEKCGYEIPQSRMTMYYGKKLCSCRKLSELYKTKEEWMDEEISRLKNGKMKTNQSPQVTDNQNRVQKLSSDESQKTADTRKGQSNKEIIKKMEEGLGRRENFGDSDID